MNYFPNVTLFWKHVGRADAQLTQFTLKRDRPHELYTDLLMQQQVATVLEQSAKAASVSVEAILPDKKSSPMVVLNIALTGMLGLMLSVVGVLVTDWCGTTGMMNRKISKM